MADSKDMLKVIIDALQDKKAEDIRVIDISNVSVIADYFIIASGGSPSQINALVDSVEEKLAELNVKPVNIEGIQNASWVLMDYGDIIIHIFSKNDREFYNLERIWADCKEVDVDSL